MNYPAVFLAALSYMGRDSEIEDYMERCRLHRDDCKKYSLYTHGYLIPMLDRMRQKGQLYYGKCTNLNAQTIF